MNRWVCVFIVSVVVCSGCADMNSLWTYLNTLPPGVAWVAPNTIHVSGSFSTPDILGLEEAARALRSRPFFGTRVREGERVLIPFDGSPPRKLPQDNGPEK